MVQLCLVVWGNRLQKHAVELGPKEGEWIDDQRFGMTCDELNLCLTEEKD